MALHTEHHDGLVLKRGSSQCSQSLDMRCAFFAQNPCSDCVSHLFRKGFFFQQKRFCIYIVCFSLFGGFLPESFALEKNILSELDSFSIQCIQTGELSPCQSALSLAELLQRHAASVGNYGCQSRLLGLGADLLMISFKTRTGIVALEMLEEVQKFCGEQ